MGIMTAMDLQAALIAHLHWKSKLSDFFYGLEDLKAENVADHTSCEFGKWLYSRGLKELAAFPETEMLEQLHKEVHERIRLLVAMSAETRHSPEGRQGLAQFQEKCNQLVALLEDMEQKAKQTV
jgi:uncharacterized protein (DUF2164 family)